MWDFRMLYCSKDYKNVTRDKKLLQNRFLICFWGFVKSVLEYKKFFRLEARSSIPQNIRNFLRMGFVPFLRFGSFLLKYKDFFRVSVSQNKRKIHSLKYKELFRGFRFSKHRKSFLLRKCKKFFNIRVRKFHFSGV